MKKGNKHLSLDDRYLLQDLLYDNKSSRKIAKELNVHPSTISREVRKNRTIIIPKRTYVVPSKKCKIKNDCKIKRSLCKHCISPNSLCRDCKRRDCTNVCDSFLHVMCAETEKWPYICSPKCEKRKQCTYPKCNYKAEYADMSYRKRLIESREGIDMTEQEYKEMCEFVKPLTQKGQSPQVIWMNHPDKFPVGWRSYYSYAHNEKLREVSPMSFPKMVKYKQRKKTITKTTTHIDRTGHEYIDFQKLTIEQITKAVEVDTVVGRRGKDKQCILTMHFVSITFQIHILLKEKKTKYVKEAFDAIETYLGSRKEFKRIFNIILLDRGDEFNNFLELEMSCLEPGKKRCNVYFCDPCASHQKAHCENNHVEIRKILPKCYTNFDSLNFNDIAIMSSHVNSYRRPTTGQIPLLLAKLLLPENLLCNLGIELVEPDCVTLKPSLLPHTQIPINK